MVSHAKRYLGSPYYPFIRKKLEQIDKPHVTSLRSLKYSINGGKNIRADGSPLRKFCF